MSAEELRAALAELGLRHSGLTLALLGVGRRQVLYMLAGRSPVSPPVANLVRLYLYLARHNIPPRLLPRLLRTAPRGFPRAP